jgi:hypothetical protein
MAKHILAIDETGSFTMSASDKSFVCGVSISLNELEIKRNINKPMKRCGKEKHQMIKRAL